ncbi:hypothetical protein [Paenibacillus bovis]|uniref:Uncharacterized protein n=1 Tax=Paenibacillus bovis TaxID=1616788 RepID=A0A172ZBF3_9BACL|nr:hypothetical protein [Paenibacillus bovis]ANF94971.1 hypothetical protein AR543_02275 [Paenibacillus bovis]
MKKITIVKAVVMGSTPQSYQYDKAGFFRKSLSRTMEENLSEEIRKNQLDYVVEIDQDFQFLDELLAQGTDFILISPYVSTFINFNGIPKERFYIMTPEEFDQGEISHIMEILQQRLPV